MKRMMIACVVVAVCALPAMAVDHSAFDKLLKKHVKDGLVDYSGLAADKDALAAYVDSLANVNDTGLRRHQQMALYLNAFNACTMMLVLEHGGAELPTVQEIPVDKLWNDQRWAVAGGTYTLDQIVNDVLRARFKDARIHAAINRAAMSSPPMRAEAYDGERLKKQLDDQCRAWIANPRCVMVTEEAMSVNEIFNWYEDDFKVSALGVNGFISHFASNELKGKILALGTQPTVNTMEFDWTLNEAP